MKKFVILSVLISFILLTILYVCGLLLGLINGMHSEVPQWILIISISLISYASLQLPLAIIAWFKEIKELIKNMLIT